MLLPSSLLSISDIEYSGTPFEAESESVLLLTGGYTGRGSTEVHPTTSTKVYPTTSGCSLPPLPTVRRDHVTFITSDPDPVIATCGGAIRTRATSSCLVLDQSNQRWDDSRMGRLTTQRYIGAITRMNFIGVFFIGGHSASHVRNSDFLAAGSLQWQKGPALPVDMRRPCAVTISATSFLAIFDNDIREFDVAIAGPTSTDSWRDASRWPKLKTRGGPRPGCAKVGQKVIIAGGANDGSTELLDLIDRSITSTGNMAMPRRKFPIATVISGGKVRTFALGGYISSTSTGVDTVEEWVEESSTWKGADSLTEARYGFGAVAVPRALVCPA